MRSDTSTDHSGRWPDDTRRLIEYGSAAGNGEYRKTVKHLSTSRTNTRRLIRRPVY